MTKEELQQKLFMIFANLMYSATQKVSLFGTKIPEDYTIELDAKLIDDLGLDSLDRYELSMKLEEEFDLERIEDNVLLDFVTVEDVLNYLCKVKSIA